MIVRCAHGHVCLVNAGHTLHPLLLDPCEGFDERERVMLNHDWTKATASNPIGNCLEARTHRGSVQIRDSKDPDGPVLTLTPAEWLAFLDGVRKGELDLPAGVTA